MTEPEAVQDAPPPATVSPFRNKGTFTTEKAREMLAKARAAKAAKAEARRQAELNPPPPVQKPTETLSQGSNEELELVQEQITLTREVLNSKLPFCTKCERGPIEPHHRAQLLRALDALLDRKRILQERPLPGSRRPAAEPRAGRPGLFAAPPAEPSTLQGNAGQEQE